MQTDADNFATPPLVRDWGAPELRGRCRWIWSLFLAGLVLLGAGDWYMRIHWFNWHRSLVIRPTSTLDGPRQPLVTNVVSTGRGGDLSHMLAIPAAAAPFEDERPAATNVTDEFGFRNAPPVRDRRFPVVVVGDSYMYTGPRMQDTFPAGLSEAIGVPVYNHAYDGRGPFWGLVRFLLADRFKGREPEVLVWGVVEREMAGRAFAGIAHQLAGNERILEDRSGRARFDWDAVAPSRLHVTLPNTSTLAAFSRKSWNRMRYRCLGRLNPDVVVSTDRSQLFYRFAAEPLFWSPEQRNAPQIVEAIAGVASNAAQRNMRLVVVLIPDKERIHLGQIPTAYIGRRTVFPSMLGDVAAGLQRRGIAAVDLTPAFVRETAAGHRLYWRDDTHWNTEGIQIGVREAAPLIRPLLESAPPP